MNRKATKPLTAEWAMLLPQQRVQKKQRVIEPKPFSCVHCSALTSRFEDMEQLIGHIPRRHTLQPQAFQFSAKLEHEALI